MNNALIALGSNLGQRKDNLHRGLRLLLQNEGIQLRSASAIYETVAEGVAAGSGDFLNAAALLETTLTPRQLANVLFATEDELGRWEDRLRSDGARGLDLDLILFDDLILNGELILPHPRYRERAFVLAPAAEIAPELIDPVKGKTIAELWYHLRAEAPLKAGKLTV
ncbi:2-amino-4-hydroxy-6-hydroxymethyldihydropteridine diphosphokinase [bacterium]|nr:2-amino-4-hydroxy-6-hydroxymethyldihydropteridine diphosphokinase [bacterium]